MALTMGYNPQNVTNSINKVKNAYENLITAIGNHAQSYIVDKVANQWACQEAVEFFKKFKDVIEKLNIDVDNTFETVVNSMKSAATAWAQATSGPWGAVGSMTILPLFKKNKKINIGLIKEKDADGNVGINPAVEGICKEGFNKIMQEAAAAVKEASDAVQNSGFIDSKNQQSLYNSLKIIENRINNAVINISHESKVYINNSVDKYQTVSKKVSNAFQGKQS